jgi:hypothetical protein
MPVRPVDLFRRRAMNRANSYIETPAEGEQFRGLFLVEPADDPRRAF